MPPALGQPCGEPVGAPRLRNHGERPALKDEPPAGPPVPAHSIHPHPDRPRPRGVHVHPLGLARGERLLGHIARDRPVGSPAEEARGTGQAPGRGAGLPVLGGDRRRGALSPDQPPIYALGPGTASRGPCGGVRPRVRGAMSPAGAATPRSDQQAEGARQEDRKTLRRGPHRHRQPNGVRAPRSHGCRSPPSRTRGRSRSARRREPCQAPARTPRSSLPAPAPRNRPPARASSSG